MPQEKNPLLDPNYFGGVRQQGQNPLLNPSYFGGTGELEEEDDLTTAIGRKRAELKNIAQNKERLKAISEKSTDLEQKKRIKRILDEMDEDDRVGVAGTAEDFGRGALAGVANAIPSVIDLALTPADLAGIDAAESARRKLAERQQLVRETVDPKGFAGGAGEFVGAVAGSAIPYGMAASATGRVAAKLVPGLAKQIAAGKVSQQLAKRIIANVGENVIGGSIINAMQAAGLPDATIKEKAKSLGIGIAADVLFGAAQGAIKPPVAASKAVAPGELSPAELAKKLEAEGKKRLAIKEAESQVRKLAKADWQVRNPTGNWQELTKAQKQEIYDAMKAKLTAEGAIKRDEGGGEGEAPGGNLAPKPPTAPTAPGGVEVKAPSAGEVPYVKSQRTPEQLENLRNAGGEDDPIIQEIRADKSLTRFEKEKAIIRYRADVRKMQKEVFGKELLSPDNVPPVGDKSVPIMEQGKGGPTKEDIQSDENYFLSEQDISESWDDMVRRARTSQPMLYDNIKRYADELGVNPNDIDRQWSKIDEYVRKQLFDKIRAERKADLDEPIREVDFDDAGDPVEGLGSRLANIHRELGRSPTNKELDDLNQRLEQAEDFNMSDDDTINAMLNAIIDDWLKSAKRGAIDKEGTKPPHGLGIRGVKGAITGRDFWDNNASDVRERVIGDWLNSSDELNTQDIIDRYSPDDLIPRSFDKLPKEIQDFINQQVNKNNEIEIDVGRTVFEPDAARRQQLARPTVPEDIKSSFTDLIIDAVQGGLDEASFVQNLIRFARENELPDEAVFNTLEDSTGWIVKDGQLVGSPLESPPATPIPEALPSEPALPAPATALPTPPPTKGKLAPGSIAGADLSTLDLKAIDKLKDKVFDALDADPDNQALLADLNALAQASRRLARPEEVIPREPIAPVEEPPLPEADLPPLPEAIPPEIAAEIQAEAGQNLSQEVPFAGQVRPDYVQDQIVQGPPRVEETPLMDPLQYAQLARTSPRKLDDATLQQMIDETDLRIRMNPDSPEYKIVMDKLAAEKAARRPPPPQANMPPAVGGAVLGYAYGLFTGDDENRQSNALMWAMAGALGGAALGRAVRESKPPKKELFPGQSSLPKVISYEADRGPKTLSPLAAARRWYSGIVRSTAGLESIYQKTNTAGVLPTQQNAAKMASIFGRWVAVAERWMTNRPVILGADGEPVYLDSPTLKEVGELVGGDIENLDEVAVALTTLENVGKINRLPMDPVRAQMIVANATPDLIQGAQGMRKYALALADAMVDAGILSPDIRDRFAAEQWYTPLQRVFGDGVTKQQIEQLAKMGDIAISPNPVKGRKGGSTMQVKSPFETLQRMTAQYIRAAEYNKIKQQFIAFAKANPQLELIQRVDSRKNPTIDTFTAQIAAVKKLVPSISTQDAASLAVALGEDIDPRSPIMTVYEDGTLRSYRIHEPVFDAFKAMLPSEMSTALKLFAVPTQFATRGVVHNPFFIAQQFFVDTFQAALMSKYGFRPVIDSVRGWWNAVSRSPEYKRILDLGGPATIQSLPYINPKSSSAAIKTQGATALETAARQIKELRPIEAYKTLAAPIAEAARIGEALRALDHGESTISAVYAAWHATGNTRMQGHFGAVRAFNLLTMFSRPAISAMDEALTKAGVNPFRRPDQSKGAFAAGLRQLGFTNDRVINGAEFLTKGFAFIGLPSIYLWYHNLGDEELDQLRQTESGQRYWFFRGPETEEGAGQIYKVRKPHVLGQLFGSTLEATLDQMYQRDPENTVRWVGGIVNDAALNILPQFGVVPFALWGNKIPGLDIPIVPESDLKLEPQLMGAPQASNPARVVADKLAPISSAIPQEAETLRRALSPAGLDYIFGTIAGMMGQDAVMAADVAINYYDSGIVPAKYELPIVGRLFGRYPQMNTRSVRDFYRKAEQVETAALSFTELLKSNPAAAMEYLQRHQMEISLAQTFQSTRQTVANMLRAVEDLKGMLRNRQITQSEFRRVEEEMLRQIITQTGLANSIANQIMMESP